MFYIQLLMMIWSTILQIGNGETQLERVIANFYQQCPSAGLLSLTSEQTIQKQNPIRVSLEVSLYRLQIDDIERRMSVFATAMFTWNYTLCQSNQMCPSSNGSMFCGQNDANFFFNQDYEENYWTPKLIHLNAFSIARPFESAGSRNIRVYPFQMPFPQAKWIVTRQIDSFCKTFNFKKFPYDKLTCYILFTAEEPVDYVKFDVSQFGIDQSVMDAGFIPNHEVWEIDGQLQSMTVDEADLTGIYRLVYVDDTRKIRGRVGIGRG